MDEPPKHGTLRQAVERSRRRNRRRRYQQWRTCIQKMPPRLTWTVLLELGLRRVINSGRTGWRRCPRKPNFSRRGPPETTHSFPGDAERDHHDGSRLKVKSRIFTFWRSKMSRLSK